MLYKENSIIICNNSVKTNILTECFKQKMLCNYTFINLDDFIKRFTFRITDEAVVFAMKFLNMSYKNTLAIINNIYYIDSEKEYMDEKLVLLSELKKTLIEQGLLEYDLYFKEFINGKNIYLVDQFLDVLQKDIFTEVSKIADVIYVDIQVGKLSFDVVEFDKYEQEVEWVFGKILDLLLEGEDINNINIINQNPEYNHLIARYSSLYKIPVFIKENESINNHPIVKEFIKNISLMSKEDALKVVLSHGENYIYNKLISILNRFNFILDDMELIEVVEATLEHTYYEDEIIKDSVKVVDFNKEFKQEEYVFLIGFNNNKYPKIYLDEEYLGDKYCGQITSTPTIIKNELERNKAIYLLSKINHIEVSYAKNTKTNNVISPLVLFIDGKVISGENAIGKSYDIDNLRLGILIDDLINFDIHDQNLDVLFSSFKNDYKTYDNSFDFVDKELLHQKILNSIKLSYTSLSTFYKCQFRYYLERVLFLKHEKDTNAIMIGNIFHSLLERYGEEGFDLETEKEIEYQKISDPSLKFYFNKLWPDFLLAIKFIDEFKEQTYLKDELHEQEVNVDYSDDLFTKIFTGKIDKIMHKNIDGVDYVSIVDYKTGKDIPSLDNIEDGFNLQLPVYAYFLAKTSLLKNPKILGIYLQRILNNVKPTKTKDLETTKSDALKLDGYSIVDKQQLELFDGTYQKSKYIKSMSLLKDGSFSRYAKVFSEEDVLRLINTVESLVKEAFLNIEEGLFAINPKSINGENKSCKFCPYLNVCYRKNRDIQNIEEKKFNETVGDENVVY